MVHKECLSTNIVPQIKHEDKGAYEGVQNSGKTHSKVSKIEVGYSILQKLLRVTAVPKVHEVKDSKTQSLQRLKEPQTGDLKGADKHFRKGSSTSLQQSRKTEGTFKVKTQFVPVCFIVVSNE